MARVAAKTRSDLLNAPLPDSPVETRMRELARGTGDWEGFGYVWEQLQIGCHAMAKRRYVYLSQEHVNAMGILGCGHEETMKAEMWRMRQRGWIPGWTHGK